MRVRWLYAALLFALGAGSSAATATPSTEQNGYLYGIKCYVANGMAAEDPRYGRDGATLTASGQRSYQVIWALGRRIGKSDALIQEDIDSYKTILRGAYRRNDTLFQQIRGECARIGLM